MHRLDHQRVLAHAEIIVRAPDRDFSARAAIAVVGSLRKCARLALEIGEDPIAALSPQFVNLAAEECVVVHNPLRGSDGSGFGRIASDESASGSSVRSRGARAPQSHMFMSGTGISMNPCSSAASASSAASSAQ